MLITYQCHSHRLQRLPPPAADDVLRDSLWIDLVRPDPSEITQVERVTGLHVPTQAEVSEIESSSRLSMRDGALYLSLPLISLADGPRTASAGFVLSRDRLITVRFHDSRVFDHMVENQPRSGVPHETASNVLVGLMEALVDRQADVLEQVRADLDDLSHRIFAMGKSGSGRKQEDAALRASLGQIGEIGDLLSHVRDTQVGLARLVPYVQTTAHDWLPAELTPRLETLSRDIASIGSFDTYVSEKLQFLLDATLGFINIAQNNVMKVLTVASVVGIPPVMMAGIWGMNFKNMPELNWEWGYAFAWIVIIVSGLLPLALFRWRKWI